MSIYPFEEVILDDVRVTITRSAAPGNAYVVFIDTDIEPDGSDGGPGLRVRLNDEKIYEGVTNNEDV